MKVVVNKCYGGFGLSNKALKRLAELQGKEIFFYDTRNLQHYKKIDADAESLFSSAYTKNFGDNPKRDEMDYNYHFDTPNERHNPLLLQVVEELGDEVNTKFSNLKIVEIPDDVEYEIEEYDGSEWVSEVHRTWY